jgi:Heterokaryon incompatibility protein (HET)/Ankyrin repeats (many copies)
MSLDSCNSPQQTGATVGSDQPHEGLQNIWLAPRKVLARSDCSLKDVQDALDKGVVLDTHWQKLDMMGPEPTSGPRPYFTIDRQCWVNYNTPFHKAVVNHHFDAAAFLLMRGISVNVRNVMSMTALHEAVERCDHEAADYLVKCSADADALTEAVSLCPTPNSEDRVQEAGIVPLHQAINNRDLRMVEILVKGNANVKAKSPEGWSLLDLALITHQPKIMYTLLSQGAQLSEESVSEADSSEDEELKVLARLLVWPQSQSPPWSCYRVYRRVLNMTVDRVPLDPGIAGNLLDLESFASRFHTRLAAMADRSKIELIQSQQYCLECIRYQEQLSSHAISHMDTFLRRSYPTYGHHSSRDELRASAQAGCILCALFEDALTNDSTQWTRFGRYGLGYDLGPSPQVTLITDLAGDSRIEIRCGDRSSMVTIGFLSDHLQIDHSGNPDIWDLGTASPRAFSLARAWLSNCLAQHNICNKGKEETPLLPSRIIDVGNDTTEPRLVMGGDQRAPYCALSYCWGDAQTFTTTKSTLKQHEMSMPLTSFPQTLRDAIIVSRELHIRYLWIDALCINQDDENDWNREVSQMQRIYADATITISALDSASCSDGLFRARKDHFTSPVPISFTPMKHQIMEKLKSRMNRSIPYILPAQAEKAVRKAGIINTRAWTMQENLMSTRVLQFGPELLHFECLELHGSESDPEGHTFPYRQPHCSNSIPLQHLKRTLHGRSRASSTGCIGSLFDMPVDQNAARNKETDSQSVSSGDSELLDADWDSVSDDDVHSNEEENISKPFNDQNHSSIAVKNGKGLMSFEVEHSILFKIWCFIISAYTARKLTKLSDRVPAIQGLCDTIGMRIEDRTIDGIWTGRYLLPSLLWATKRPGIRNGNFPSWSWASSEAASDFIAEEREAVTWEPTYAEISAGNPSLSGSKAFAELHIRSTIRRYPRNFRFWRYDNMRFSFYWSHAMSYPSEKLKKMSSKRLREELCVINGSKDRMRHENEQPRTDDLYFLVVAKAGELEPSGFGVPMYPQGTPPRLVCLCLEEASEVNVAQTGGIRKYRRIGLCCLWDHPSFWKSAKRNQDVVII